MYNDWQNRINVELQTVRQREARERCSVEARLLRVGYLDWEVWEAPRPLLTPEWGPVQGPGLLAALGRVRRWVVGAIFPAVTAGAARGAGADSR
jgi:hypothetical protein